MSGHSKWNNIKRTKEKTDAEKGKIFTKIGRELAVCVKEGGPDPKTNNKLADIISKAKSNNMPNDSIQRAIKKASGELGAVNYEACTYEGYGVGGSAVIVECLTDNKNRTAGDVRHAFDKFGGSLGSAGCVSYLFKRNGVIIIEKTPEMNSDDVLMAGLEAGASDIIEDEDIFEIITTSETLSSVKANLEAQGYALASSEISLIPDMYVDLDEAKRATFEKMIEKLEDLDDVQQVYHNVK